MGNDSNQSILKRGTLDEHESVFLRDVIADARAPSTRRAYRNDVRRFTDWCAVREIDPFPVEIEPLLKHIIWMVEQGRKLSTIERSIVSLSLAQDILKQGNSLRSSVELREFLKGLRRRKRREEPIKEAPALMLADLKEFVATCDVTTRSGLRDRALLVIGWFGAFRRSELVALNFGDVREVREGLRVHVRHSKTDQEARGAIVGLPRRTDALCPVAAVRAWRAALRAESTTATEDGAAVFVALDNRCRLRRLAPQAVERILRTHAGPPSEARPLWTPHSLRAGFATEAARAGKAIFAIKRQTRHRSLAVLERYMREAETFVGNAADL